MKPSQNFDYNYLLAGVFYIFFILLTPLGLYNDWVDPFLHTGHYSLINMDEGDDAGYYAFLRSSFFDKDLDFFNEHHYIHSEKIINTGYVFNNWQIGQALLYIPFFMVGHGIATILNGMGYSISVDGYSFPYSMSTALASQSYLFMGLLVLYKILRRHYSQPVCFFAVIFIWSASPLIYYTFIRQRMAHTTEFFGGTIFLYLWVANRNSPKTYAPVLFGFILAILCSIRLINIVYYFFLITDQFVSSKRHANPNNQNNFNLIIIQITGAFLFFFLPQLLTWHKINGAPYPTFIMDMAQYSFHSKNLSQIFDRAFSLFFGGQWGMFFSAPIIILGSIGWFIPNSPFNESKISFIIIFLLLLGISLAFPDSASYGERYFFPIIAFSGLGLGSVLSAPWKKEIYRLFILGFCFLCLVSQYIYLIQYKIILRYDDPSFTLKALGGIPGLLTVQKELFLRSSNWINTIKSSDGWPINDLHDLFFLVGFPITQFTILILIIWVFQHFSLFKRIIPSRQIFSGLAGICLIIIFLIDHWTPKKSPQEIYKRIQYIELISNGDASVQSGKALKAFNFYNEASSLYPQHWTALIKKGIVLSSFGNVVQAEKHFRKALNIFSDHSIALFEMGNLMVHYGKFSQAKKFFIKAIRVNPSNSSIYRALGSIYIKRREFNKAEKIFSRALILNPHEARTHLKLAELFLLTQQNHKAKQHIALANKYGIPNSK